MEGGWRRVRWRVGGGCRVGGGWVEGGCEMIPFMCNVFPSLSLSLSPSLSTWAV